MQETTIEALLDAGADPMARNAAGETPWDLAKANKALKGSDAYWRLNEARFEAPGRGTRGSPTKGQTPTSDKSNVELAAAVPSSGPGCEIPGYPSPPGVVWRTWVFHGVQRALPCKFVHLRCRRRGRSARLLRAALPRPEQINARRQEIKAACGRLDALTSRLGGANCQCPPGLRP